MTARRMFSRTIVALAACLVAMPCWGEPNELQSPDRPQGLDIVGVVHEAGSDARSAEFSSTVLPEAMQLVEENLDESVEFVDRGLTRLDTDRLYLLHGSDRPVRVYYCHEYAGYRNSLGYSTSLAGSDVEGVRQLIFPDVSNGSYGGPVYLEPGDWVELGDYPAGTQFEFFIIRDAINGGSEVFTNRDDRNPDGLQHMVAWLIGERYVLVGFEDIVGGGDLDYNDVVFVVDLSPDLGVGPLGTLPF